MRLRPRYSEGALIAAFVHAAVFLFVSGLIKLRQMRTSQAPGMGDYLNTFSVLLWWWMFVGPPVAFLSWWFVHVRSPRS